MYLLFYQVILSLELLDSKDVNYRIRINISVVNCTCNNYNYYYTIKYLTNAAVVFCCFLFRNYTIYK